MTIRDVHTPDDWQHAEAIRQRVFVEEQACPPEEEWDAYDAVARHVVGFAEGAPAATARWRVVDLGGRPAAKLERFAVLPEHRGHGHGRRLVAHIVQAAEAAGYPRLVLHAQAHLEAFYASFGFRPVGEPFDEAGIPHVKMVREGITG